MRYITGAKSVGVMARWQRIPPSRCYLISCNRYIIIDATKYLIYLGIIIGSNRVPTFSKRRVLLRFRIVNATPTLGIPRRLLNIESRQVSSIYHTYRAWLNIIWRSCIN